MIVRLENAAIERSSAVDSSVLGKYGLWRRENDHGNSDKIVRQLREQIIVARVFATLAQSKDKLELFEELTAQLKESQQALGRAIFDSDLQPRFSSKLSLS